MKRAGTIAMVMAGGLAALFVLLGSLPVAGGAPEPRPERAWTRTRFSTLTSEVWRYGARFERRDLEPVPDNNPFPEPQPGRDRPGRMALGPRGDKLYVVLTGTEARPGREVAVVDVSTRRVLKRIGVGARPYGIYPHPRGRFLVVTNELSNYASVIDTRSDVVSAEIPADFYCHGLAFSPDGRRAFLANGYLDQVLVAELEFGDDFLRGRVVAQGGFNERDFLGDPQPGPELEQELLARGFSPAQIRQAAQRGAGGINAILRARCGSCHAWGAGGFQCGDDATENFLSAVEFSVGGRPEESLLYRAVVPLSLGGYGDQRLTPEFHAGGVCFQPGEPELERLRRWILQGEGGPGIPVGNEGSHPKDLALSADGRHLFVGNTGTNDVSIIDTSALREVGAIYTGSPVNELAVLDGQLVVLTFGAGFGAHPARDPLGAETRDRDHPAAEFSILRDPATTDPRPLEQQAVLGEFDAVDGTWNARMRDIQNDLLVVDLSRLAIPAPGAALEYLLLANRYEAHPGWVRYTSDTAEATTGDCKGDIPPELQRVHGAFPEAWAVMEGRLYVAMAGSFEVVEHELDPRAADPAMRLAPTRVWPTGLRPAGLAAGRAGTPSAGLLFAANQLGESLTIIDTSTGKSTELAVGALSRPPLDTDAERGELLVHTSVFTSDGDTSCLHCHYRDTGDGRPSGASEVIGQTRDGHITSGGTLNIPQMRNIFAIQPYYFEGTHRLSEGQGADLNEPAGSQDFDRPIWAGDFTGVNSPVPHALRRPRHEEIKERVTVYKLGAPGYDLDERREEFWRRQSMRYFGHAAGLADLYRYTGAWLGNTTHLLPNPIDRRNPSVQRGAVLFNDASVMCGVCHTAPEFTNKTQLLAPNDRRALPTLTTITRRDASYTLAGVRAVQRANGEIVDAEPEDPGRVEEREGSFTTMQLRGILFRPPTFLHHGRARSLREVLCTPEHPALRRGRYPYLQGSEDVRPGRLERGFNEITARHPDGRLNPHDRAIDTHGGTSHLTPRQIEDLVNFMKAIE